MTVLDNRNKQPAAPVTPAPAAPAAPVTPKPAEPAPGTVPAVEPAPVTPKPAEPTVPAPASAAPVVPTQTPAPVTPAPAAPVVTQPPTTPQTPVSEIPLEERYRHSSAESIVLNEQNKTMFGAIDEANKPIEPTEAELRVYVKEKGADWDELSTFEKSMAKDSLISNIKLGKITSVASRIKEVDKWHEDIKVFINDPNSKVKYPLLAGREAEFASYATRKTHRGVDFDVLMQAFLFSHKPTPKPAASMPMAPATGAQPVVVADKNIEADEAKQIRINDPKRYAQLIKTGKLKHLGL